MINPNQLKIELEKAIKNREDNELNFNSEFQKGELSGFKEVLRRINQFFNESEKCSFCQSTINVMPKTGSGVESNWVCLTCVNENNIDVLPEYLENIQNFGHWHRPLSGDLI
jgi:hypothetical protein